MGFWILVGIYAVLCFMLDISFVGFILGTAFIWLMLKILKVSIGIIIGVMLALTLAPLFTTFILSTVAWSYV